MKYTKDLIKERREAEKSAYIALLWFGYCLMVISSLIIWFS